MRRMSGPSAFRMLDKRSIGVAQCDCKAQLDAALGRIADEGLGIVIYLRQEGRGIGLGDKVRAYRLQEDGVDTVDANRLLGLHDDLRTYDVAGDILKGLNVRSVRLMTNNPEKVNGLSQEGIEITKREPHVAGVHAVNQDYVWTKRDRMGHLIAQGTSEPEGSATSEEQSTRTAGFGPTSQTLTRTCLKLLTRRSE